MNTENIEEIAGPIITALSTLNKNRMKVKIVLMNMKDVRVAKIHIAKYLSEFSLIPACLKLRLKKGKIGRNFLAGFRNGLEHFIITWGGKNVYGSFIIILLQIFYFFLLVLILCLDLYSKRQVIFL